MGARYRVLDLPVNGLGAFCPTPAQNPPASSGGLSKVRAILGNVPVPVPAPTRVWAPVPSNAPLVQDGNASPDVILPVIYVASAENMGPAADAGFGMATRRLAPLPVPALSWIAATRAAMAGPKMGGRAAATWPRAFQRFPNRSDTTKTAS